MAEAAVTTWVAAAAAATLGVVTKIEVTRALVTITEGISEVEAAAVAIGITSRVEDLVEIMDLATIKAILEVRIGVDFVDLICNHDGISNRNFR